MVMVLHLAKKKKNPIVLLVSNVISYSICRNFFDFSLIQKIINFWIKHKPPNFPTNCVSCH